MIDSGHTLRARREWVEHWLKHKDAGLTCLQVCKRVGILVSRIRRYANGERGLPKVVRKVSSLRVADHTRLLRLAFEYDYDQSCVLIHPLDQEIFLY